MAAEKIDLCHSTGGETWVQITVSVNALGGHENHDSDIWPPVPGVTAGMNWDAEGFSVWANSCSILTEPTPTTTSTPPPTSIPTSTPTVSTGPTSIPIPLPSLPAPTLPTSTPAPVPVVPSEGTLAFSGAETSLIFLIGFLLVMVGGWLLSVTRSPRTKGRRTR